MGKIFKCDRCGRVYEEKRTICIKKITAQMDGDGEVIGSYDLCNNCVTDFTKFTNNEEITKKPSLQQILEATETIEMDSPSYQGLIEYMPAIYHAAERKKEDDEWMY